MFQKLKRSLIQKQDFSTYLKYAAGEIFLIVIGILIAVSINNWNRDRQQENLKTGILKVVANDLQSDTTEAGRIINFYEDRKSIFQRVVNQELTEDEVASCKACRHIITTRRIMSLNTRGFLQLQNFQSSSNLKIDSLTTELINFYTTTTSGVESLNELINDDVTSHLQYMRNSFDWYSDYILDQPINREGLQYFGSAQDYKNRVAYHYVIVYENYLPLLNFFKFRASKLLGEIDKRSN